MSIDAHVIADSVSPTGIRLTTLELEYHRFIHSEFMTHRVFSRNASSSRAIPIEKMIKRVSEDPAIPIEWGANKAGMQAGAEVADPEVSRQQWLVAAQSAVVRAYELNRLGLHKQIVNRVLEPFSWIKVLVTATEWDNFFQLRDHEDAQPEIRELARQMRGAMDRSTPKKLGYGEWHLPYISGAEVFDHHALACSVARCARVSYLNHDQSRPSVAKDALLFGRLVKSKPMHASPTEHQATPRRGTKFKRNFRGWRQYRCDLEEGF